MSTENRKPLLLHTCCAPCSTAVVERLINDYDVVFLFFNPNIMPPEEYQKRLSEQKRLADLLKIKLIEEEYNNEVFLKAVKNTENGQRCEKCIELRLKHTAVTAKKQGVGIFTTTLSVSPHKNSALINRLLEEIGTASGVKPLCEDFKKRDGFKRSVELSEKYGLYRQKYCGCIFN
jgi:hypothetical protein